MYISLYIQDEYRRLCVFLFVLLFTVPVISYFLLRDVLLRLRVAEEFLFISARRRAYHLSLRLFIVYSLLSSSHSLHRLSPPTPRAYIRVVIFHVFIIIFLFVNLLPFFRWLPIRLEPQPCVNCWREPYFKNTVNLLIHIARIPIGDSPRVNPNILKCLLHSPVAKGYRLVVIASRAMVCKNPPTTSFFIHSHTREDV